MDALINCHMGKLWHGKVYENRLMMAYLDPLDLHLDLDLDLRGLKSTKNFQYLKCLDLK